MAATQKMRKKQSGPNKHQKAAHKKGDHRTGSDEIEELLELSRSDDTKLRQEAAQNLCPCHVRTRKDEVWDALYRMMEDPHPKVRRDAWHTLEDGGYPEDDARMDAILDKAMAGETDKSVRGFVAKFAKPRLEREQFISRVRDRTLGLSDYDTKGKCDFCGQSDRLVKRDYDTPLSFNGESRSAMVCEECDR